MIAATTTFNRQSRHTKQRSPRVLRTSVIFETCAEPGSQVFLAGTFNDWDASSLPLQETDEEGVFRAQVPLRAGRYEYKFVVDGEWVADVACPYWTVNEFGSLNSIVVVDDIMIGG